MGIGSPWLQTNLTRRVALVVLVALFSGAPAAYADTFAPVAPASLPAVDPATTVAAVSSAVEPIAAAAGVEPSALKAPAAHAIEPVRNVAKIGPVVKTVRAVVAKPVRDTVATVSRHVSKASIATPTVAHAQLLPKLDTTNAAPKRPVASAERVVVAQPQLAADTTLTSAFENAASAAVTGYSAVPVALEREARVIPHGIVAAVGARPSPAPRAPLLSPASPLSHSPGTAGWTDAAAGFVSRGGIVVAALLGLLSLAWPRPGRRQAPRARFAHPTVPILALERPG